MATLLHIDSVILSSPSTIATNVGNVKGGGARIESFSQHPEEEKEKEDEEELQYFPIMGLSMSSVEEDQEQGVEVAFVTTPRTHAMCLVAQDMIRHAQGLGDERSPMGPQQESIYQKALCLQETVAGYFSEGTCHIHRILAWHFYQRDNYPCALTHFLQSLKISMELDYRSRIFDDPSSDLDSLLTLVIMDDIQDVLEDMQLPNDFVNRVIHAWDLQDEATEKQANRESSPQDPETIHSSTTEEERILQQALALLPIELDLERAGVYTRLAHAARRQEEFEQAMSYYRQALMILPQWLTPDHPQIVRLIRETHLLASNKKTIPVMTTTIDRLVMVESRKAFGNLLKSKLSFKRWSFLAAE
jgi:hypothetical protein